MPAFGEADQVSAEAPVVKVDLDAAKEISERLVKGRQLILSDWEAVKGGSAARTGRPCHSAGGALVVRGYLSG